jgi:uncharacterized repeat protein (TIGR01451 family)
VLATSLSATAQADFGPDRPTQAWSCNSNGFDHVTFDSFTGVPTNQNLNNPCDTSAGTFNEEQFLTGVQVGRDSTWNTSVQNVTQSAEVEAKIYIHNNADTSLNTVPDGHGGFVGVAQNVTAQVSIPSTIQQTQDVTATISASNAQPQSIFDTMDVTGANGGSFGLQYENGTAQLHEQDGSVTNLTAAQESALTGSGLNLGSQAGCFQHVQEITFKMKVNMPQYNILKQVRFAGQGPSDWKKTVTAQVGNTLEWSVSFSNIGQTELDNVAIVDQIPANMTVVPGSVTLYTADFPNGTTDLSPNPIQANGSQLNVNIGNYRALTQDEINSGEVSAQIIYRTTVNDASLACGANDLVNKAFATPQGFGTISDTADASVTKQCTTPTPPATTTSTTTTPTTLVNTGPGDVIGLFSGVTIAGAFAHRLFLSRRLARRGL